VTLGQFERPNRTPLALAATKRALPNKAETNGLSEPRLAGSP
jgi:hypothetical protein